MLPSPAPAIGSSFGAASIGPFMLRPQRVTTRFIRCSGSPSNRRPQRIAIRWGLRLEGEPLHRMKRVVTLWGLSMNGPIDAAPKLEPIAGAGDGSMRAQWIWKTRTWILRIDPEAEDALVEEDAKKAATAPQ